MELFQSTRPMRGATRPRRIGAKEKEFQSTRPMRGATNFQTHFRQFLPISIHAPHAGRDLTQPDTLVALIISIHAPHAGRDRWTVHSSGGWQYFNPRAPCGARLILAVHQVSNVHISIHAPHAGRDSKSIQNYFTHFCDKRQFLDNFTQNAAF